MEFLADNSYLPATLRRATIDICGTTREYATINAIGQLMSVGQLHACYKRGVHGRLRRDRFRGLRRMLVVAQSSLPSSHLV